ncbi:OmpA family protein [Sphingobacterium sp.]|uniref:OmpA family protein n=1 Tax=Sphingobacterium sp. TaxID=341027 RepID=UPI0028AEFD97|nr:OmpA family protein [Sphingobacterium sp.]
MENQLLKGARDFFDEETVAQIGQVLNQDNEQVKQGLNVTIPALFLGLSQQFDASGGIAAILEKAKQHFSNFDLHSLFGAAGDTNEPSAQDSTEEGKAQGILGSIFGGGLETVLTTVSGYLGIDGNAIGKLMNFSLPAIFSSLTNKGQNWDFDHIGRVLQDNKTAFAAAVPAGLGLGAFGKLFDGGHFSSPVEPTIENEAPTEVPKEPGIHTSTPITPSNELEAHKEPLSLPRAEDSRAAAAGSSSGGSWWKILIALIVLAALWFLFGKGCSGSKQEGATDTSVNSTKVDSSAMKTEPGSSVVERERTDVVLPNGVKLAAFKGGIEDQLVQFLKSDYKSLGEDSLKNTWFDFDNLNFKTGTAEVLPESQVQLSNLAAILKAFPTANIKIGGYTDKTGNEDFNKKLSLERATAVKDYLGKDGLSKQVTGAEGYGSQFAKYNADAPETDRILDRHVSVSVR